MDLDERSERTRRILNELIARSGVERLDYASILFQRLRASRQDSLTYLDSSVWQQLALDELPDWIQGQMDRPIPPMYELAFPAVNPESSIDRLLEFEPTLEQRPDSGIWQIRTRLMPGSEARSRVGEFFERLMRLAPVLDERDFNVYQVPQSDVIIHELRSRVPEMGMPVIGPGGRVTVYVGSERIEADLVVRHRLREIQSDWISPEDVLDRIARRIADDVGVDGSVRAFAAFGYFELSKYERQALMRPAFAVIFETIPSDDMPGQWQSVLAEPATFSSGISLAEGLGSWVE